MPLSSQDMRDLFPITRRYAYLDHASIAPLSTPVRAAIEVFLSRQTEEPFDKPHWSRLREQVRSLIAQLLQVRPETVTFVRNTTSGLGLVAAGMDWEPGDNIVGVRRVSCQHLPVDGSPASRRRTPAVPAHRWPD